MSRRRAVSLIAGGFAAVAALLAAGCDTAGAPGYRLIFSAAEDDAGSCLFKEQEQGGPPKDLDALTFTVRDEAGKLVVERLVSVADACADDDRECVAWADPFYELTGVKPGLNYVVEAVGLAGQTKAWRGVTFGVDVEKSRKNDIDIYMKRSGAFTFAHNCQDVGRAFHAAVTLRNGRILIAGGATQVAKGGCGESPPCDKLIATNVVEEFNPDTGEFRLLHPMKRQRAFHQMALLNDGRVLITGGAKTVRFVWNAVNAPVFSADPADVHATAEIYNPESQNDHSEVAMDGPRMLHTLTRLTDTRYLLVGGWDGGDRLATAEMYEHGGRRFADTGHTLDVARAGHTASLLPDGRILIYGGAAGDTGATLPVELFVNPTDGFSPFTGIGPVANTSHHSATLLTDGRVLIVGGLPYGATGVEQPVADSVRLVDPVRNEATRLPALAGARSLHAAGLLPDGSVVLVGGVAGRQLETILDTVERYADGAVAPLEDPFGDEVKLSTERFGQALVPLRDGTLFQSGGFEQNDLSVERDWKAINSGFVYQAPLD